MKELRVVMQRKAAFRLGWNLIRMSSGTSRVGLWVKEDNTIELLGTDLIKEEWNK